MHDFGDQVTTVIIVVYESFYRSGDFVTQLPFELKLNIPPTDLGKKGYSSRFYPTPSRGWITMTTQI